MAMKKNSPYKIFFDWGIQNMRGNGELHLYEQRNSNFTIDCNVYPEERDPSDFLKTASIFIMLLFGALLSILFLFHERFKKSKSKSSTAKELKHTEEKMNLYYNQICIMAKNFENTDIQALRKICQVPDPRFCRVSGNNKITTSHT